MQGGNTIRSLALRYEQDEKQKNASKVRKWNPAEIILRLSVPFITSIPCSTIDSESSQE